MKKIAKAYNMLYYLEVDRDCSHLLLILQVTGNSKGNIIYSTYSDLQPPVEDYFVYTPSDYYTIYELDEDELFGYLL